MDYTVDRKRLSDIYATADVFVNLTRADTLPTVNIESICCGTPVITFNGCGCSETVDESCGYIVKEGDVDGLIASIQSFKENPISFNVQEKQRKFDKNECYKKYLDIYSRLSM